MDHVVMASHASQYMSWWWPSGVLAAGVAVYAAALKTSHRLEDTCRAETRIFSVVRMMVPVGVAMTLIALALALTNVVANSKNYEAANPSMDTIASRLHLYLLPSQQGSSDVDDDHSRRIYLNNAGQRFTGCYVERSRLDAGHYSFRLMCDHDGTSAPAHD